MKKKSGKLRLVLDTRVANCHFKPPPSVRLPTAAALCSIECAAQQEIYFAGGDIDNAFYRISIPPAAAPFMTLPRIKAKYLAHPMVNGRRVGGETWIVPELLVLPMGWTWSLWYCQTMHEHLLAHHGIPRDIQVQDRKALAPLSGSEICGAIYVDNFMVVGHDPQTVGLAHSQHVNRMNDLGLHIHEEADVSTTMSFAGLEFDGASRQVRVSCGRVWKIRLAIDHILGGDRLHGKSLEVVVGHITWALLARRETLSVFSAVYRFIDEHQQSAGVI